MKKRHRRVHHEEHADETWLIPYADLLTLLLALFIVLFASSQIDQQKFSKMITSFESAFGGPFEGMSGGRFSVLPPGNQSSGPTPADKEMAQLKGAQSHLEKFIQMNKMSKDLEAVIIDQGMLIRIRDNALFASGSADMFPEARQVAAEIAKLLVPLNQNVIISGHTDNVPINTYEFPTNWDLSSKRALNFMKFLLAQEPTLKPEKFSAIGYGEYRPLASNDSIDGRAKNRRVEVLILKNFH